MLVKTAAVFISFATMLALHITRCRLLLLGQTRAITGSSHPVLGFVHALERGQRGAVDYSTVAGGLGHRDMMW